VRQALKTFPRQALHACRASFVHPVTHATVVIDAPLPRDMRALERVLGLDRRTLPTGV
jgi:23S rRNA pseudouridine1911/1915/1917 synthase